ncbi:MAG: CbtA family protein [Cenarchaeum sp. SB0661_bin_35]|nr:CbtA family protein [Cenarchaeum sp. SB0666_bin_15]MYC80359.1 CbtA family protein [Cenarchaeum sp. SB0661_bin_35]MYD59018.1 CbtA family protein [Cenarchaeum sp. SB0678_bin_8]
MNTILFISIVLIAGAMAGTIHGLTNLALVEPYLDNAIMIENQALFASGQAEDTPEFWAEYKSYRSWQKEGQVLASAILGTSMGALFGIVYVLSRDALPKGGDLKKASVLAAIMWFSVYLVPFFKYPANPPTVGDGETVVLRAALYLLFIGITGFGVVVFYQVYRRLTKNKRFVAFAGYAALVAVAFVLMPPNPDENTIQTELLNGFRIMSAIGVTIFWTTLAIILGVLWQRLRPDSETNLEHH